MEKEYARVGNIVVIISLYGTDERKDIEIGEIFTITRVTEDEDPGIYGHKSGTVMILSQLGLIKQEIPLVKIFREGFGLVHGDRFRFKNDDRVWEMFGCSFYIMCEDGLIKYDNKMLDKIVIGILEARLEIEKIIEPIFVEVIIKGEKFKVTEEIEREIKAIMTGKEGGVI